MRAGSAVASRSLVWPWNSGSRVNADSIWGGAASASARHTPCPRPLRGRAGRRAGDEVGTHQRLAGARGREIFLEPVGKMERLVRRHAFDAVQQFLVAMPADLDAADQVGL